MFSQYILNNLNQQLKHERNVGLGMIKCTRQSQPMPATCSHPPRLPTAP